MLNSNQFILHNLDNLVEQVDKDALHKRRAAYLEFKIEEIVKTKRYFLYIERSRGSYSKTSTEYFSAF